jgi:hypothetical protein
VWFALSRQKERRQFGGGMRLWQEAGGTTLP